MKTLLYLLTILLLIGCERVENLVTPDKYKSKKDYPKGYALIDVELFMKKGTRVEYSSPNKKVVGEYDIMTLLIVKDTLKHGDFVNVSFFSRDYENSWAIRVRSVNKHTTVLFDDKQGAYDFHKWFIVPKELIE